jgi:hypothetical protein
LFNHFFREFIPKKVVFEFLNQFAHLNIKFLPSYFACHDFLDPFLPKSWKFGFKARGLQGHVSSATYVSNLLKDKDRRLKTKLTLSLILQVNLRLGGYSIWSVSLIAPHIKEDLTTTRGMSISQRQCSQGSTRKNPSRWSPGELEDASRSTRTPAVLDFEELRGLSDLDPRDCAHSVHILE